MVGSANVNRRGMEHDSEMGVVLEICMNPERCKTRERLWRMHLGAGAPPLAPIHQQRYPSGKRLLLISAVSVYDWSVDLDRVWLPAPLNDLAQKIFSGTLSIPPCP